MTDNNNDIDNDLDADFDDAGFDDYSKKGTLGDMWRNNPMVKIGVILAGFAIVVGGIILFGGMEETTTPSRVASGNDVSEAPGTSEVSASMQRQLEEANIENTEEALRTNASVMPIPISPPVGAPPLQVEEEASEDPLERWRRMQEERLRQQEMLNQAKPTLNANEPPSAPPVDTRTPAINAMSESMVNQMQSVLKNEKSPTMRHQPVSTVAFIEAAEQRRQERQQAQLQSLNVSGQGSGGGQDVVENILLPAATIEYGQLLLEANTDAPGPVLVQLASGPLKGARLLGSFVSTERYITLNFNQMVIDGISYDIEAVAIDPNTTLPGMVTDIDNRYFKRVVLPMAAEFVEGLTEAIARSGSTSVFITDTSVSTTQQDLDSRQEVASGVAQAGEELSDILDDEANSTRPMLKIRSGTPVGILFVRPVTDQGQTQ